MWLISGPMLNFSDTWQLIANTFTTLVTFLMVFLVQNTQNRDAKAIHAKLDTLISAIERADNRVIGLQYKTDKEISEVEKELQDEQL